MPPNNNNNDNNDSDSDDSDFELPVIAIDHLRAVSNPEQLRNRDQHVPGLQVGGPEACDLFELDEEDPLLQQVQQEHDQQQSSTNNSSSTMTLTETEDDSSNEAVAGATSTPSRRVGAAAESSTPQQQQQQQQPPQHGLLLLSKSASSSTMMDSGESPKQHPQQQPAQTPTTPPQTKGSLATAAAARANTNNSLDPNTVTAEDNDDDARGTGSRPVRPASTPAPSSSTSSRSVTAGQAAAAAAAARANTEAPIRSSPHRSSSPNTRTGSVNSPSASSSSAAAAAATAAPPRRVSQIDRSGKEAVATAAAEPQQQQRQQASVTRSVSITENAASRESCSSASLSLLGNNNLASGDLPQQQQHGGRCSAGVRMVSTGSISETANATSTATTATGLEAPAPQNKQRPPPLGTVEEEDAAASSSDMDISTTLSSEEHDGPESPVAPSNQQQRGGSPVVERVQPATVSEEPQEHHTVAATTSTTAATASAAPVQPQQQQQDRSSSAAMEIDDEEEDDMELAALAQQNRNHHRSLPSSSKTVAPAAAGHAAANDAYAAVVSSPATTAETETAGALSPLMLPSLSQSASGADDAAAATAASPTLSLQRAEHDILASLDAQILQAEETDYIESLSDHITAAEEGEYIQALAASISVAEKQAEQEQQQQQQAEQEQQQQAKRQSVAAATAVAVAAPRQQHESHGTAAAAAAAAVVQQQHSGTTATRAAVEHPSNRGPKPHMPDTAAAAKSADQGSLSVRGGGSKPKAPAVTATAANQTTKRGKMNATAATNSTDALANHDHHVNGGSKQQQKQQQQQPPREPKSNKKTATIPYVTITKTIPRLLPGDEKVIVTRSDFESLVAAAASPSSSSSSSSSGSSSGGVEFHLDRVPDAPEAWSLHVQGPKDVAKRFLKHCDKMFRNKMIRYNHQYAVTHGIEVELRLCGSQKLGGNLSALGPSTSHAGSSLLVVGKSPKEQLARAMGYENSLQCAAVMSVNGKSCGDIDEFKMLTKTKLKRTYRLLLRVSPDVDVSQFDPSMATVIDANNKNGVVDGGQQQQGSVAGGGGGNVTGAVVSSSSAAATNERGGSGRVGMATGKKLVPGSENVVAAAAAGRQAGGNANAAKQKSAMQANQPQQPMEEAGAAVVAKESSSAPANRAAAAVVLRREPDTEKQKSTMAANKRHPVADDEHAGPATGETKKSGPPNRTAGAGSCSAAEPVARVTATVSDGQACTSDASGEGKTLVSAGVHAAIQNVVSSSSSSESVLNGNRWVQHAVEHWVGRALHEIKRANKGNRGPKPLPVVGFEIRLSKAVRGSNPKIRCPDGVSNNVYIRETVQGLRNDPRLVWEIRETGRVYWSAVDFPEKAAQSSEPSKRQGASKEANKTTTIAAVNPEVNATTKKSSSAIVASSDKKSKTLSKGISGSGAALLAGAAKQASTKPGADTITKKAPSSTTADHCAAEAASSISKKRKAGGPTVGVGLESMDHLPRKKARQPEQPAKPKEAADSGSLPEGGASAKHAVSQEKLIGGRKEYHVRFSTQAPLGLYCVTDRSGPKSICKVLSVCPYGQSAKDPRIQAGSTIRGVVLTGDIRILVASHQDLREIYESVVSGKCRSPFCEVVFVNAFDRSAPVLPASWWTKTGVWRGKEMRGWDGRCRQVKSTSPRSSLLPSSSAPKVPRVGLKRSPPSSEFAKESKQSPSQVTETMQIPSPEVESVKRQPQIAESKQSSPRSTGVEQRLWSKPSTELKPRSQQSNGQLGPKKSVPAGKKVAFSPDLEQERCFDANQPVTERLSLEKKPVESENTCPSLKQRQGTLEDAIRNGTISDVQEHLARDKYSANKLLDMKEVTKKLIKAAKGDKRLQEVLDCKYKLLKIYINAFHVVRSSKMLKHWERLEVSFQGVEGLHLTDSSLEQPGCRLLVEVYSVHDGTRERLPDVPPQPVRSTFSFGSDLHPYFMNFNFPLSPGRCLEVNLLVSKSGAGAVAQPVGTILIHMSEVHKGCPPGQGWKELAFQSTESEAASSCSFKTKIRRTAVSPEYLKTKRDAETARLKSVLDWIKRFNEESPADADRLKLTSSDIRVMDKESLLHAAVLLQNPDSVDRLLKSGSDPSAKSGHGSSALSLAQNMADGCAEVQRKRMEKIVELLREENKSRREKAAQGVALVAPSGEQDPAPGLPAQKTSYSDGSRTAEARPPEVFLPRNTNANWLTGHLRETAFCRAWEQHRRCGYAGCRFVHVQQPWVWQFREFLAKARTDDYAAPKLEQKCIHVRRGQDSGGRCWFTAGYSTCDSAPKKDQFVFYAEGGSTAQVDKERGITWYPSQAEARKALESVVLVSHWARRHNVVPPWRDSLSLSSSSSHNGRPLGTANSGYNRAPSIASGTSAHPAGANPRRESFHMVHTMGSHVARGEIEKGTENSRKRKGPPSHEDASENSRKRKGENKGAKPHRPHNNGPSRVMQSSSRVTHSSAGGPAACCPPSDASLLKSSDDDGKWGFFPSTENVGPPLVSSTTTMPRVRSDWIEVPRNRLCKFFQSGHCRYGEHCSLRHIQLPADKCFSDENLCAIKLDLSKVEYLWEEDSRGRQCVTCKYRYGNVIRYSQGRRGSGYWDSVNRLWWYTSADAARGAIVSFRVG